MVVAVIVYYTIFLLQLLVAMAPGLLALLGVFVQSWLVAQENEDLKDDVDKLKNQVTSLMTRVSTLEAGSSTGLEARVVQLEAKESSICQAVC